MKEVTAYGIVNYNTPTLSKSAPKLEGREYARYTGLNTVDGFNAVPERVQLIYANCISDIFWDMEAKRFFSNISCDIDDETYNDWCDKHEDVVITCLTLASENRK